MSAPEFGKKGRELLQMYATMAKEGYERSDNTTVTNAFSDFELRPFRAQIKTIMAEHGIASVLDYGCGGSNWNDKDFDPESGLSAKDYFNLTAAYHYEPARNIDQRQRVDCVVNFDVLEHIFITDVPAVIRNILSYAGKLAIVNVACYPAAAKLPNGENAHITVRPPLWWKGVFDAISPEFPDVSICLFCSTGWRQASVYPVWSAGKWNNSRTFVIND
ncbi:MAG TPA: hypothetical protein VMH83_00220 [Candidatus Acidoferrum sp.]|nr:hypothetical protein [Candidatus Acidoferrum sp.]